MRGWLLSFVKIFNFFLHIVEKIKSSILERSGSKFDLYKNEKGTFFKGNGVKEKNISWGRGGGDT